MGIDIGSLLTIGTSFLGGIQSMKDQTALYKAQIKQAVMNMNYDFQNMNLQRGDLFEATVDELTKVRMNQQSLAASVQAGINENFEMGGRTADLLERSIEADEDRAAFSIKNSYDKQNNEINFNMLMAERNMNNQIRNLTKPNPYLTALSTFGQAYSQYQGVKTKENMFSLQGLETNLHGKVVKKKDVTDFSYEPSWLKKSKTKGSGLFGDYDWLTPKGFTYKSPYGIY